MAHLYAEVNPPKQRYYDKKSGLKRADWDKQLDISKTCYVGNLAFYTNEEQIYELFSKVGSIVKVTMGLNKFKKQPCGFCFVEYRSHEQAVLANELLNGAFLDERAMKVDLDAGVSEGRQFGRGESGNQWRDDFRSHVDNQRGGQGLNLLRNVSGQEGKNQLYVGEQKNAHGNMEDQKELDKAMNKAKGGIQTKKRGNDGSGGNAAKKQKR